MTRKTIYAVHFLGQDMRPKNGHEKPWKVGETRTITGTIALCKRGYHYCHDWESALLGGFLYGPIACVVKIRPTDALYSTDAYKGVTHTRTLVGAWDVEREMRLFAADEAERYLKKWERHSGKIADPRSWAAVKAGRAFAAGEITPEDLSAAWSAAASAAASAAESAASAARSAASAAWSEAWSAAWSEAWSEAWSASAKRFAAAMTAATGWERA